MLGIHLHRFPSGRYGFVGSLPTALGKHEPANMSDVLAGRVYRNANGEALAIHFPTFATTAEAKAHASACGVALCAAPECSCREFDKVQP